MDFYIIIPAHNEQDAIGLTLNSLVEQTLLPKKIVVVNDNSTDDTKTIVETFTTKYDWISLVNIKSSDLHLPGTKIINAFYKGFGTLDENYDVICKFDADLIFPNYYLKSIATHFINRPKLGMAAGFCYIKKKGEWVLENLTRKDHIRGALKAYRKTCYKDIGGLKPSIGWDTVDELLAKYHGWELKTDKTLIVKHLKPTGINYVNGSNQLQGEALYKLRYGFILTLISAMKLGYKKKNIRLFIGFIAGYFKASQKNITPIVTKVQGKFIRKIRWKGIKKRVI